MISWDTLYKVGLLVLLVSISVATSGDLWAGVVVGVAMLLTWYLVGVARARQSHH